MAPPMGHFPISAEGHTETDIWYRAVPGSTRCTGRTRYNLCRNIPGIVNA